MSWDDVDTMSKTIVKSISLLTKTKSCSSIELRVSKTKTKTKKFAHSKLNYRSSCLTGSKSGQS